MGNIITLLIFGLIYYIANQFMSKKIEGAKGLFEEMDSYDEEQQTFDSQRVEELVRSATAPKKKSLYKPIIAKKEPLTQVGVATCEDIKTEKINNSNLNLKSPSRKELRKAVIMSEILAQKF